MTIKTKKKVAWSLVYFLAMVVFWLMLLSAPALVHAKPPEKSKFYDFSEQLINGEVRKPTGIYLDARQRVKFGRLLRLKRSFMRELFATSKEQVFK